MNLSSRRRIPWALILLAGIPLLLFGVLYLIPVLHLLQTSLYGFDPNKGIIPALQWTNYKRFLTDSFYLSILWRTVRISLLVTFCCAVIGYPVSYFMVKAGRKLRMPLIIILLLPLVTSPVVVSYGWLVLLGNKGMVNQALMGLGIIDEPVKLIYDEKGIIIGLVQVLLSFMVLAVTASLENVDWSLVRAARSLGASSWRAFWSVVFPLSLPGLRNGALLVFSLSMSAYATPALIGGPQVKVMSYLVYEQGMSLLNWPFGATMSVVLLASTTGILGLVSAFEQWRHRRITRLAAAGGKGGAVISHGA